MSLLNRRELLGSGMVLAAALAIPQSARASLAKASGTPFDHARLVAKARRMARAAYVEPYRPAPAITDRIDYEAHGKIKFHTDQAPYADRDGAYPVTFFHLGKFFNKPVHIYLVEKGRAREFRYSPSQFDMPADSPARHLPENAGFAGFRFQEWNSAGDWRTQDWIAFLGASYFRAIGGLGQYGLSARGLVVDAALPDRPEEFPDFVEFYIEETSEDPAAPVIVHTLLDGPSVTGAYRFAITRGLDRQKGVIMDVDCTIFLRRDVGRLGLLPLTSMFWYGDYGRHRMSDWRPEVHDSDGLAIWTADGERIWRPLNNPQAIRVSSFAGESPRGFGLLQRDRNFENYQDGVRYDRRPSLWIEPLKPLGAGSLELLEIPTDDEIHDNIGAFWVPAGPAKAGNRYNLSYRMYWTNEEPFVATNIAQTIGTRIGPGGEPGKPRPANVYRFSVEFDRPEVMRRIPYGVFPEAKVSSTSGTLLRSFSEPVPDGNIWRAIFDIELEPDRIEELRLYLELGGVPITETWLYQFEKGALVL